MGRKREKLGAFLTAKRKSLSPADAGLPSGGRRRTEGLRREEVAHLAGIGLTWYTWAEQGRDINVSPAFLSNVARALQLDHDERQHLFLLAGQSPPANSEESWHTLPPLIRQLLDDLTLRPAYVMNLRWDILGWNKAGQLL